MDDNNKMIIIYEQDELERNIKEYYHWMIHYYKNSNNDELVTKYQNVYNTLMNNTATTTSSSSLSTTAATVSERMNNINITPLESYPELYRRFMGIRDNLCQQCVLRRQQQQQQKKQKHKHATRNEEKKKLVFEYDGKFPSSFEKRYEILQKYYNCYGHCDVNTPDDEDIMDDKAHSFHVQLLIWTMSLRRNYQTIINKPNRMPISSTRPQDLTPDRIKMLSEIKFDFKASHADPVTHTKLYEHQIHMEKQLKNCVKSNYNNKNNIKTTITNNNKSISWNINVKKEQTEKKRSYREYNDDNESNNMDVDNNDKVTSPSSSKRIVKRNNMGRFIKNEDVVNCLITAESEGKIKDNDESFDKDIIDN